MESFSATKNLARVTAGFKGGNFFGKASTRPAMSFVEGWPKESIAKFGNTQGLSHPTPIDSWNERRRK